MIERVLVAGGGTGGHLFPGIAVVEELRRRCPSLEVLFVGTERGIEARVVPAMGERFQAIEVRPLKGRSAWQLVQSVAQLPRSGVQAISVLRDFRPDLVLGLGGYAAGPVLLAASALRIPSALLEQNAQVGLTNRLLAHRVGRAYLTFEETAARFGERRARVVGNPVRRGFVTFARMAELDPAGGQARSRRILVLGGSQGAAALNREVPVALALAGVTAMGVEVVHQAGAQREEEVRQRYVELGVRAEVLPFIDDMARAYRDASLVIARAGASTLAEVCAIGRPAILIPYPYAADDHQARNALALERAGAAIAIREADLTTEVLAGHVAELMRDAERRRAMAQASRRQGRPEAAAAVVDDLLAWLGGPGPQSGGLDDEEGDSPSPTGPGPGLSSTAPDGHHRRARVKRGQLRIRAVDASIDAA